MTGKNVKDISMTLNYASFEPSSCNNQIAAGITEQALTRMVVEPSLVKASSVELKSHDFSSLMKKTTSPISRSFFF